MGQFVQQSNWVGNGVPGPWVCVPKRGTVRDLRGATLIMLRCCAGYFPGTHSRLLELAGQHYGVDWSRSSK